MKKIIVLLLLVTMCISGCNKPVQGGDDTVVSEVGDASQSVAKEDPQSVEINYSGGTPWIDTSIIGNINDDMEVSAKDDFYLYANYEWLKNAKIPDGFMAWGMAQTGQLTNNDRILEAIANTDSDSSESQVVRDLYAAMNDWDARNELGVEPLAKLVEGIQSIKSVEELSDYICDPEASYGVYRFINLSNVPDNEGHKYVLKISCPNYLLGFLCEYDSRSEKGNMFHDAGQTLVEKMLTRVGFTKEEADQMFEDSVAFEGVLTSKMATLGGSGSPTRSILINSAKLFPIERLIEALGYGSVNQFYDESGTVLYINELGKNYTQEQLENFKNLMIIKAACAYASVLDQEAYDAWLEYVCVTNVVGKDFASDLDTTGVFEANLREPLLKVCLEYKDCKEMKERVEGMTKQIIEEYETMLEEEDWLSDQTKKGALEKLRNLKTYAIYADDYNWPDFSELDIKGLPYVEALKKAIDFTRKVNSLHTAEYVDESIWMDDTYVTNAFYISKANAIKINWGMMTNEVYRDGMSDEELYAGLGTVIGHEISHAFDLVGAGYDKEGRMSVWWQIDDTRTFYERAKRVADYYASMSVWEGASVTSIVTNEAMADMGSMKVILRMAEKHEDFDYDKFFRAYASFWKMVATAEYENNLYMTDTHPLSFIRCNSVLQQFDQFFETYDIKEGDNMYLAPKDRVLVW